ADPDVSEWVVKGRLFAGTTLDGDQYAIRNSLLAIDDEFSPFSEVNAWKEVCDRTHKTNHKTIDERLETVHAVAGKALQTTLLDEHLVDFFQGMSESLTDGLGKSEALECLASVIEETDFPDRDSGFYHQLVVRIFTGSGLSQRVREV